MLLADLSCKAQSEYPEKEMQTSDLSNVHPYNGQRHCRSPDGSASRERILSGLPPHAKTEGARARLSVKLILLLPFRDALQRKDS